MGFTSWDAGLHREDPNSLQHYGVLGMKWGQRRYQNSDGSLTAAGKKHYEKTGEYGYNYHSHSTKKYNRKATKMVAKKNEFAEKAYNKSGGNSEKISLKDNRKYEKLSKKYLKYKNRADRSAELDRREQDYAQRVRTGGNIAVRLLTKTVGGKSYQQHLAMNKDTTSLGSKAVASILSYVAVGRVGSMIRKANYIRQDEKAAKRAAKGKAADRGAAFRERAAKAKTQFMNGVNNVSDAATETWKKKRK